MKEIEIVTSVPTDVSQLSHILRKNDRVEIELAFRRPAIDILMNSFRNARNCWSVRYSGRTIAIFGVGRRKVPRVGTVWMLSSDELFEHRIRFIKTCGYWVNRMMDNHDVLTNFVHAKNGVAIRLLKWMKFDFLKLHHNFNGSGEDFWLFAKFANNEKKIGVPVYIDPARVGK